MTEPELTGAKRVAAAGERLGLELEFARRGPANSLEEAAGLLGIDPADIVKSLIVKHKQSYLFALIPGGKQISWPKLRAMVGANRLSMPPAAEALAATGYERGTITPLGSTADWPIYADESIRGRRISMGGGEHGVSVFVDSDSLLAATNAVVADISD